MQAERAAEIFAEQRSYLLGVSYRLTGSWADAEDLVAEAWPRWAEHADEVVDPRAWLTRVVGRLSLDHLRSARVRRETYVGPWLPEPLITAAPVMVGGSGGSGGTVSSGGSLGLDPLDVLVQDESVRMAFLVVLDELSPEQRLAVVLHDVLGLDFADIADVLGCSVSNARQHASRGRRRLSEADPAPRQSAELAWSVLGEMSTALFAGDVDRLTRLLAHRMWCSPAMAPARSVPRGDRSWAPPRSAGSWAGSHLGTGQARASNQSWSTAIRASWSG